jgi:molecular chaperone GrpE
MEELLPVLDNFELGLTAAEQHGHSTFVDGFRMILSSFRDILTSHGLGEINPLGEKFDLNFHECVRQVDGGDAQADTVVAVDRKGYMLQGKLLRPAIVAVAKHGEQS